MRELAVEEAGGQKFVVKTLSSTFSLFFAFPGVSWKSVPLQTKIETFFWA
jgi:hypothetical protein